MATKRDNVYRQVYKDMLDLNKRFIDTMSRPTPTTFPMPVMRHSKRKLTKKQLDALAGGRKKLASKRGKPRQI